MNNTTDKKEMYDYLQIKDGRNIGTQQALDMFSKIRSNDKDVAFQLKCVEAIPDLANIISTTIQACVGEIDTMLARNDTHVTEILESYKEMMVNLQKELDNNSELTSEQRLQIINQIGSYNNKRMELHIANQEYNSEMADKILKFGSTVTVMALGIVAGILGVKFIPKKTN